MTRSSTYTSGWRDEEVDALGELADTFFARELVPHRERWDAPQHHVDRDVWVKAGELGLLCCSIPEEYGGGGGTYAHDLVVIESQARALDTGFGNMVHSGIVAHYLFAYGTEEQRRRWLPKMAAGSAIAAVAMTEPGAGSDLKAIKTVAVRDGEEYVLNGSKTFISNGSMADLVVVVAKTDPAAGAKGISLIVVETADCPGFIRGRVLDKVGQQGADTSELFFDDVRVPVSNVLGGEEGHGFAQLMTQLAQERLAIGVAAVAMMESAVAETIAYVKTRKAFDQTIFDFQNTKFVLAECQTVAHTSRVFIDSCIERHLLGELDATTTAMCGCGHQLPDSHADRRQPRFCAGMDLNEGLGLGDGADPVQDTYADMRATTSVVAARREIPQPMIDVVRGHAVAAGFTFAAATDIRICAPDAQFNAVFVKIGMSSGDLVLSWSLPKLIGPSHASDLFHTGGVLDAATAARLSLVSHVAEDPMQKAISVAALIAAMPPLDTRMTKELQNTSMRVQRIPRAHGAGAAIRGHRAAERDKPGCRARIQPHQDTETLREKQLS